MLKVIGRILLILLAVSLVSGALYLLLNGSSGQAVNFTGERSAAFRSRNLTPDGGAARPANLGFEREGRNQGSAFGLFGITAKALVIGLVIGLVALGQKILERVVPGRRFSTG